MSIQLSFRVFFILTLFSDFLSAKNPPNVVIFLADDAGWGDYSHSGNKMLATPNIDSLAVEGVSLNHFFVQPVCSPTRAELLTGRYYPRSGVRGVTTGQERINLDEKTIADTFKEANYATGAFGKWHNGSQWPYHPMARGFDEYFGHTSGHWGEYFDAPLEDNGKMVRTKGYITDVCTDKAIDFINRNKEKPFFCLIPFTTPHSPWAVPENFWQKFKTKNITQTATNAEAEIVEETRCVMAMMENQDYNVGRVLEQLKHHGIDQNTIIVYFSDNGPNGHRWTGGMKGKKAETDEGGVRSVCYIRWPSKLPQGLNVEEICGAIDLLPTLSSLAGVVPVSGKPLDGLDLSPLLSKQSIDWKNRMIFHTWGEQISVRTQTHRLDSKGKLFDMKADPGQTKDINAEQPELVAHLSAAVKKWQKDVFQENARSPKKNGNGGNFIDSRPIPVGYPEFPITLLPARDGEPRGEVQRSSKAANCSYFVNWKNTDDLIVWPIDVHSSGKYEVSIEYTCKLADVGSNIELTFKNSKLTGKVEPGWDPPLYTNQDTLPRPVAESQMKEFRTLTLGEIVLVSGPGELSLRAIEIPGQSVMDLRRITLKLLP